jgi:hypothetical protein
MGMGQAAGTAAGISISKGVDPREISIPALQDRLISRGAILEAPQSGIKVGTPDW